ncbi:MAG: MBL fold metallo-hydrolase [Bacillota bacterium]|nr:MBL fold metallo-hydrolase [Bacillota bacterium]
MANNILQKILERPMAIQQVNSDVTLLELPLVNAFLVGNPSTNNGDWVLVGAGMAHTGKDILQAAEGRFGKGSQPKAIILTHAHFDHVGAILELLNTWPNVPVYAHQLELPYLKGQKDYPPADPTVNDGLIAMISPTFPNKGVNLGNRVQALPVDGSVPWMAGWKWIHTPGHSPGMFHYFVKVMVH